MWRQNKNPILLPDLLTHPVIHPRLLLLHGFLGRTRRHQGCLLSLREGWPAPVFQQARWQLPTATSMPVSPGSRASNQRGWLSRLKVKRSACDSVDMPGAVPTSFSTHCLFSKGNAGTTVPTLHVRSTQLIWVHRWRGILLRWITPPISPTCYLEDIYETEQKVHSGFSISSNNSNKLCD